MSVTPLFLETGRRSRVNKSHDDQLTSLVGISVNLGLFQIACVDKAIESRFCSGKTYCRDNAGCVRVSVILLTRIS